MKMEFGRNGLQKGLFLVMGITVWLAMTTIPTSTATQNTTGLPSCWLRVDNCLIANTGLSLTETENFSPSCCPIFRRQMQYRKCFCSIEDFFINNPEELGSVTPSTSKADVIAAVEYYGDQFMATCRVTGTFWGVCNGNYADTTPSTNSPSAPSGRKNNTVTIVIVAVVVIVGILIGAIVIICICRRKRKTRPNVSNPSDNAHGPPSQSVPANVTPSDPTPVSPVRPAALTATPMKNKDDFMTVESLQYNFATLQAATNNFSNDNIIGRGGFGYVYKGALSQGQEIAVKRLSHGSGQGDKEFEAEVALLAKLQHKNLVRLLGFCLANGEACLVYELVPNKSLDYFLFDKTKRGELTWPIRFEVIRGVARGLLYLHEDAPLRTVHRDLKAANILLDAKMGPQIADFGLARICALEQTHVDATRVLGTRGYMSPEYLLQGQFSVKSDVYAFGVLVLEIISGRSIGNGRGFKSGELCENLMTYAWRCWEEEKPLALVDPLLEHSFSSIEVVKCMHLGLLCVQDDVNMRPSMSKIVQLINSSSGVASLPTPQCPGQLYNTSTTTSSSDKTTTSVSWIPGLLTLLRAEILIMSSLCRSWNIMN